MLISSVNNIIIQDIANDANGHIKLLQCNASDYNLNINLSMVGETLL